MTKTEQAVRLLDEGKMKGQAVSNCETPTRVGLGDGLGPLPEPEGELWELRTGRGKPPFRYYTQEQVRDMLSAERERCAVAAWNHYMDTCHKNGIAPTIRREWCASDAIRRA